MKTQNTQVTVTKAKTESVNKRKMRKGFTLIEIVFVAVIIAILAGMIIPKVLDNAKTSEYLSTIQQDLQSVKSAIGQYKSEGGKIDNTFTTAKLDDYFPASIINTGEKDAAGWELYEDANAKNILFSVGNNGDNIVTIKPIDYDNLNDKLKQKIVNKIKKQFNCEDGKIDDTNQEIYGTKCKF